MRWGAIVLIAGLLAACTFPEYEFSRTDACTPNECGGCTPTTGKVGDPCGDCGKLACVGTELACTNASKNACGSCGPLTLQPGDVCHSCGSGVVAECRNGVAVCPGAINECGGCAMLGGKTGHACTRLDGCPGTLLCKGIDALECTGTPMNECGGCTALTGKAGDKCPTGCGTLTCASDKRSLVCEEPSNVGTQCGICPESKYACDPVSKSVKCAIAANEKTQTDFAMTSYSAIGNGLCSSYQKGMTFTTKHRGRIERIRLRMQRDSCSTCTGCGSVAGSVTLQLYEGAYGDTSKPRGSAVLSTATIGASDPDEFVLGTGGAVVSAGTQMWFSIATDSTASQFTLLSQNSAPSDVKGLENQGSGWKNDFSPYMWFETVMNGCF